MSEIYHDPIIEKYFDLIKSVVGDGYFKEYYQGDPIRVPMSKLPCLIISKAETRVGMLSNAEDEQDQAMILTVITDMRKEINNEKDVAPGTAMLYNIIEGREDDTLKLKTTSILHILRNNISVDTALNLRTDLGSITRIDYGMTIGKRALDIWAIEAQVEFIAHFTQIR